MQFIGDLEPDHEMTGSELTVLAMAARQRDEVERVEAELDDNDIIVRGSKGQVRLHPALTELRGMRLAVARLLGELDIPGDGEQRTPGGTVRSERARHAARARWEIASRRDGRRHGPAA